MNVARWSGSVLFGACLAGLLEGCVSAPPPGPSVLALPGNGRSPVQFQADDARCRASAGTQIGLPANVAATNPTAGALSTSQATQERYNSSYSRCMIASGDEIPATGVQTTGIPGVDTTVDPYAYGGYGNENNIPVATTLQTGPVYTSSPGWGWGWGWDGWYGGLSTAYGYGGYTPWIPFGLSIGWGGWGPGWGYGGWRRGWGYGGWGHRGWGGHGWGGGWHGGGWGRGNWGRPGWGGGWHGGGPGGFRGGPGGFHGGGFRGGGGGFHGGGHR